MTLSATNMRSFLKLPLCPTILLSSKKRVTQSEYCNTKTPTNRHSRHVTIRQLATVKTQSYTHTTNTTPIAGTEIAMGLVTQTSSFCDRNMLLSRRRERGEVTAFEWLYQPSFAPISSLKRTRAVSSHKSSYHSHKPSRKANTTSEASPRRLTHSMCKLSFVPGADTLYTVSRSTSGASESSEASTSQQEHCVEEEVRDGPPTTFEEMLGPRRNVTAFGE